MHQSRSKSRFAVRPSIESVDIGDIVVAKDETVLRAETDDSILVFVFSSYGVGGACHFQEFSELPRAGSSKEKQLASGKAMIIKLLDTVASLGEGRNFRVKAKIFGGIGKDATHSDAVKNFLTRLGVPVCGGCIGGAERREIYLFTNTGRARVRSYDANLPAPLEKDSPDEKKSITTSLPVAKEPTIPTKKRVLIVDDSKSVREMLANIISSDPDLEVAGMAAHPLEADRILSKEKVDVITLDIHMPEMDGVTYLKQLLPRNPIPVVMVTALSIEDSDLVLNALELGAIDYIQKPKFQQLREMRVLICETVRAAAQAKIIRKATKIPARGLGQEKKRISLSKASNLIAIGASTGGTEAIKEVLLGLPPHIPPVVIVQHIPPFFSKSFADRLNEICAFPVKEAEHGDEVLAGRALIAPGGLQMRVERKNRSWYVQLDDGNPVNRHKPSVDVLFESIVESKQGEVIGILLTGMGSDGAKGLLSLKNAGAHTIAQDENSCVVFGMPKEAIKLGGATEICALGDIAPRVLRILGLHRAA